MRDCWAKCLGGCAGGFSAEHLITESLFKGKEICVNGFQWCRTTTITIPPTNLTANILCAEHNSRLSPIDEAGLAAFRAFREAGEEQEARRRYLESGLAPYHFPVKHHDIGGHNFERWLLKTLINLELAGGQGLPIGRSSNKIERPPRDLIEIAFGEKQFQPPMGLHFLGKTGEPIHLSERVKYISWILDSDNESYVSAGQFLFYGCGFVLNLNQSQQLPRGIETEYGTLHTLYRPNGFDIQLNNQPSQRIDFIW